MLSKIHQESEANITNENYYIHETYTRRNPTIFRRG